MSPCHVASREKYQEGGGKSGEGRERVVTLISICQVCGRIWGVCQDDIGIQAMVSSKGCPSKGDLIQVLAVARDLHLAEIAEGTEGRHGAIKDLPAQPRGSRQGEQESSDAVLATSFCHAASWVSKMTSIGGMPGRISKHLYARLSSFSSIESSTAWYEDVAVAWRRTCRPRFLSRSCVDSDSPGKLSCLPRAAACSPRDGTTTLWRTEVLDVLIRGERESDAGLAGANAATCD